MAKPLNLHVVNKGHIGLSFIKSLDGLRAMAAMMVVFFHSPAPAFRFEFGWAGVNLFFILSGFLITRILMNLKHNRFGLYVKTFYVRRILRIFPLYYFYLIASLLLLKLLNHVFSGHDEMIGQALSDFSINYPFLFTYTYNFEEIINFLRHISYNNSLFYGHLWTLSVEEQFYLLFPLVVYFIPVSVLKRLLVATIVLVPFLRLLSVMLLQQKTTDLFWIGEVLYVSTIFQLDALSIGACLALFDFKKIVQYSKRWLFVVIFVMALVASVHLLLFSRYSIPSSTSSLGFDAPVFHVLYKTPYYLLNNRYLYSIPLLNLFFGLLVLLAIHGRLFPLVFENRFLIWVGKISYGVYIYHLAGSYLFGLLVTSMVHKEVKEFSVVWQCGVMVVYLGLLLGVAYGSYRFLERWFLRMRDGSLLVSVNSY